MKKSGEQESVEEDTGRDAAKDDLNDVDETKDDIIKVENLLEHTKELFLKM